MNKFNTFYFEKFDFDSTSLKAKFFYSFDKKERFEEIIDFKNEFFQIEKKLNKKIINNILFSIHIALWISYYKLFPTKELVVESGYLSNSQIAFWQKFYKNWLWEFLYKNKISPKWLFSFKIQQTFTLGIEKFSLDSKKALVPVWWWKDSIVTIELLKEAGIDFDLFVFWKSDILKENTAKISWKKILLIKRYLSENLFNLNKSWYYNWHVPITWIIAFVMLFVAYIYDYKYLILSNELSANCWNTIWEDFEINHQYSKSLEFEKDFKKYVEENISNDVKYFSLLRGMYEYKIAQIFSKKAKKYFSSFSSCNANFKILEKWNKNSFWCNNCPKCAFVYTILSGFLNREELVKIFWEDLYQKKSLEKLFRELLGIDWIKPFECVGEKEEVVLWMYNALKNYNSWNEPYILQIFKKEVLKKLDENYLKNLEKKLLKVYDDDIIPLNFKKYLI